MTEVSIIERIPSAVGFASPLRVQLLDERANPTWRLLHPLVFDSALFNLRITVSAGFDTDLASVPRLPFVCMTIGLGNKAAVIHDALYRYKALPRAQADRIFLEGMEVDGIPAARTMYAAVRAFGEPSYNPEFKGWE